MPRASTKVAKKVRFRYSDDINTRMRDRILSGRSFWEGGLSRNQAREEALLEEVYNLNICRQQTIPAFISKLSKPFKDPKTGRKGLRLPYQLLQLTHIIRTKVAQKKGADSPNLIRVTDIELALAKWTKTTEGYIQYTN